MEGLFPCFLFVLLLLFITWTKYRLPGLVSSAFLSISSFSVYNLFILSGLPFSRETVFGVIALSVFSHLQVINFFKFAQKFLLKKIYTLKVAILLARKKHNVFLFELILLLLIPGSIFVFLFPSSLKEFSLLIVLGILIISALWWLFSNFYLPKLILSLEEHKNSIFPSRYWNNEKYSLLLGNDSETLQHPIRKIRKNYSPLLIFLGMVGIFFCLGGAELRYPDFFRENQLLSIESKSKDSISGALNSIKNYQELTNIPNNLQKDANGTSWIYYLFPKGVSLDSLISQLKNGQQQKSPEQQDPKNYSIQITEAFSKMPALQSAIKLSFWSLIPLFFYSTFRFSPINSLAFLISSIFLFGVKYLFFLIIPFKISELIPEISFISFLILLISWANVLSFSQSITGNIREAEDKKLFLKIQANRLKWMIRQGNSYYIWLFLLAASILIFLKHNEIISAILILIVISTISSACFSTLACYCLEKLSWKMGRIFSRLYSIFSRIKNKNSGAVVEEERVLGINI